MYGCHATMPNVLLLYYTYTGTLHSDQMPTAKREMYLRDNVGFRYWSRFSRHKDSVGFMASFTVLLKSLL